MRIKQLSANVANQIAAGEVIERPASVVKELLENTLDAQANMISIDIGFGGLNQIKVSDNGVGIIADDLPLAISAHATSKISKLNDLANITSMGFRGEALASIASVSRFSISSKPAKQEHAMMLHSTGDKTSISVCARSNGTTVEVCDLFYNAPVRRRFLKSERSEYLAIEAVIRRFALSEPTMAITLKHNGKEHLSLPAANCERTNLLRIKKIFGKVFVEQSIYFDVTNGNLRLYGWVSSPEYQRSQNDKLYVYLNQRMIKDKLIFHAIKQAYEGSLYPGRYPACLLYLTVPTADVDINVHPTKHEVRFQQPRLIHDFMVSQIKTALSHFQLTETTNLEPVIKERSSPAKICETYIAQPLPATVFGDLHGPQAWLPLNKQFAVVKLTDNHFMVNIAQAKALQSQFNMEAQSRPLAKRPLLVPVSFSVNKQQHTKIEELKSSLLNLGISLELESDSVKILTIPVVLPQLDVRRLFQDISEITTNEEHALQRLVQCQLVDVYQMNTDEKNELTLFIKQHIERTKSKDSWCVRLDVERCQEIAGE